MKKIQSTCNLCALACNIDFYVENGKIQLTMEKHDYNSASVMLRYIDKANADETRKKVMDDL